MKENQKFNKSLLPRCGGRLTIQEAADGMNAAIQNAARLIRDAEILFQNERYATALSLSILAIEESGKVTIIRFLLACPDDQIKSAWKDYRNHRAKNVAWILPDLVRNGARTLGGLREAANRDGEHTAILDLLKQVGFYTDFVGKRNWIKPDEVIEKDITESILQVAKTLSKDREITTEEMRLWLKNVGPDSEYGLTKAGLDAYFSEAVQAGIVDDDSKTTKKFIYDDVVAVDE